MTITTAIIIIIKKSTLGQNKQVSGACPAACKIRFCVKTRVHSRALSVWFRDHEMGEADEAASSASARRLYTRTTTKCEFPYDKEAPFCASGCEIRHYAPLSTGLLC